MVTRKDVAEYARVSKTTVSRVLNNNGYVSPENRQKVEEAIRALDYSPNLIARSLKTRETRQILFIAAELSNPFYMEVYQGMEDYAERHGYTIVVSRHYDRSMILQRQFDGIVLSGISEAGQKEFKALDIPAVVTNYTSRTLRLPSVDIDMKDGAMKAVDHLIRHGHRHIAFIGYTAAAGDERYEGYVKSLEKAGIPVNPGLVLTGRKNEPAFAWGYKAGLSLICDKTAATALFAFNDATAIGAVSALTEKGLAVPQDISVIGFDNIVQSRYTCPPLSTIHIPKYEQGMESVKLLLQAIRGEAVKPATLATELVVRKSVRLL